MACGSKPFLIASTNSQEGLYSRGPLKPQVPVFAQLDQPMDGLGCCFLLLCSGQLTWMWNSMLFLDFHQNTLTCICSVHAYARSRFSHVRLCNPVDCGSPGPSNHGTLQARKLEWVTISYSILRVGPIICNVHRWFFLIQCIVSTYIWITYV